MLLLQRLLFLVSLEELRYKIKRNNCSLMKGKIDKNSS